VVTHLQRDIARLERQLLVLARQVEGAFADAFRALFDGELSLGESVIDGDREIDLKEVELEEECLRVLALNQPVAKDLRFVVAVLKITDDLERIGDLAAKVAERAVHYRVTGSADIPPVMMQLRESMTWMLANSIASFIDGRSELARRVHAEDREVNRAHAEVVAQLTRSLATASGAEASRLLDLLTISQSIERAADHTKNIVEDVLYMVEGEIVRHGQGTALSLTDESVPASRSIA